MSTKTEAYGAWRSPIDAALITAETISLADVLVDGDDLYWIEGRPREGGRYVLVRRGPDGRGEDVTPPGFNVRTRVHEYGDKEKGHELGWQIVVDGLKLTRGNPSFLDGRDGILRAIEAMRDTLGAQYRPIREVVWQTFARFGMGPEARSNGASLRGVKADFSVPAEE